MGEAAADRAPVTQRHVPHVGHGVRDQGPLAGDGRGALYGPLAGEGPDLLRSGATAIGGRIPVNPSGGLTSRGHPVGATGLGQIAELVYQLRGEAGSRQAKEHARIGLAHNQGGLLAGMDSAAYALTMLRV